MRAFLIPVLLLAVAGCGENDCKACYSRVVLTRELGVSLEMLGGTTVTFCFNDACGTGEVPALSGSDLFAMVPFHGAGLCAGVSLQATASGTVTAQFSPTTDWISGDTCPVPILTDGDMYSMAIVDAMAQPIDSATVTVQYDMPDECHPSCRGYVGPF